MSSSSYQFFQELLSTFKMLFLNVHKLMKDWRTKKANKIIIQKTFEQNKLFQ